eukprot:scaffold27360_cov53-Prasinocladus_malaysianus.AAC.2
MAHSLLCQQWMLWSIEQHSAVDIHLEDAAVHGRPGTVHVHRVGLRDGRPAKGLLGLGDKNLWLARVLASGLGQDWQQRLEGFTRVVSRPQNKSL